MNLNFARGLQFTGNWTIALGAGNDSILSARLKDADSIDMGEGNDFVYVMIDGNNGTPTLSAANISKLDGGSGTDLIAFTESGGSNGQTLSLTTAGATNFENLLGSNYQETLQGDTNDNWIAGDGGADTLYGYAGNDRLASGGYSICLLYTSDAADE